MSTIVHYIVEWVGYLVPMICIPLAIYSNIKCYKHKHEMFVQKRSPLILFGLNITFISGMFIFPMLQISLLYHSQWLLLLIATTLFLFWYLLLYFLIVKQWMIFFKNNWTHYTMEREWQCILNSSFKDNSKNTNGGWFIRNNHKYGNIVYVRKMCVIYAFIGFLICVIATLILILSQYHILALSISILIIFIVLTTPIFIYVIIACKTPLGNDTFYIGMEGKSHAKLLGILGLAFMFSNVLVTVTDNLNDIVFGTPICVIIIYFMNYVSTFIICNKNLKCQICKQYNIICEGHTTNYDMTANITLDMVLSDANALHLFMVHLSKEWSLECLLSYIEINQYQKYCMDLMKNSEDSTKYKTEFEDIKTKIKPAVVFPENVPMSDLIETQEEHTNEKLLYFAKMKAHKLYNKYIRAGSEFEINLSYEQRGIIANTLHDLEFLLNANVKCTDLVCIFEESKKEMIQLINFALTRYKKHQEFEQITNNLANISRSTISVVRSKIPVVTETPAYSGM